MGNRPNKMKEYVIYFSQYSPASIDGVYSITVHILLNSAIGSASSGSGVANPSAILLRLTENINSMLICVYMFY